MRVALLVLGLAMPGLAGAAGWELKKEVTGGGYVESVEAWFTDRQANPLVIATCTRNSLNLRFVLPTVRMPGMLQVRYRVDAQEPGVGEWYGMLNVNKMQGYIDVARPLGIIRSFLHGNEFRLEAKDRSNKTHTIVIPLQKAETHIETVLKACNVEREGFETRIRGLRPSMGRDLDLWGPKYTAAAKKVLISAGAYDGPVDTPIDAKFALAAQAYYDRYIVDCKAGRKSGGVFCGRIRKAVGENKEPDYPDLGTAIYDSASGQLKEEMGKLASRH